MLPVDDLERDEIPRNAKKPKANDPKRTSRGKLSAAEVSFIRYAVRRTRSTVRR